MPKGKKKKGNELTLQAAKKAVEVTADGVRRLTLSKMRLTKFPDCLLKLPNVDELDLSRNLIKELPKNIGDLKSLKLLDLHTNKLESVPESIGNMAALTHLNLSNNYITSEGLPSTLGSLANLKTLNLGLNKLDSLPPTLEALNNLEDLGLFDNQFINLPDYVTTLPNLIKINVRRNPLSGIQAEELEKKVRKDRKKKGRKKEDGSMCGSEDSEGDSEVEMVEEKRRYVGLIVPNSVAKVNQDEWRIRKTDQT